MTISPSFPLLPYGKQTIDADDIAAVEQVMRADYLTTGPVTVEFERELKRTTGAQFTLSCSSGTAALQMAVLAAGIGPGDLVVVPTITFLATANALIGQRRFGFNGLERSRFVVRFRHPFPLTLINNYRDTATTHCVCIYQRMLIANEIKVGTPIVIVLRIPF